MTSLIGKKILNVYSKLILPNNNETLCAILLDNNILIHYFISPIKNQKGSSEYPYIPVPVHITEPHETYHRQAKALRSG